MKNELEQFRRRFGIDNDEPEEAVAALFQVLKDRNALHETNLNTWPAKMIPYWFWAWQRPTVQEVIDEDRQIAECSFAADAYRREHGGSPVLYGD